MLTGERTESATADALLGEIERDLRAGVAEADDEDAVAGERRGVAVVAAVRDGAGERRLAFDLRQPTATLLAPVVTTTTRERKTRPMACVVRHAPSSSRTIAVGLLAEDGLDAGMRRIGDEVVDDALARHVARRIGRKRQGREARTAT